MNFIFLRLLAGLLLAWSVAAHSDPLIFQGQDLTQAARGKTVVLVHGAYVDGSSWRRVAAILQSRGVKVVVVQNPLSSLAADVDATNRVIDQVGGSVILVGHSWGGTVITQAGNNPHVASLVYVSGFAPDSGQSVNLLVQNLPPPPDTEELRFDSGHYITLSPKGMKKYFAPDLPESDVEQMTISQVPWFAGELDDKVTFAAWRIKPSWWVIPENDQIIPTQLQQAMAAQINAIVTTVRSSHVVLLSHPERVARVILQAAGLE